MMLKMNLVFSQTIDVCMLMLRMARIARFFTPGGAPSLEIRNCV